MLRKLLKGSAWAFSGKVVTALTVLAVNALLTRLLTPEEMGAYFLTLSLVSVAAVVAQLGLTQTIVRLVAESMGTGQPGRARRSVILAIRLLAISGLVIASILAFGGGAWVAVRLFHSEIMVNVTRLVAVWVVILIFQSLISEIYRGFHDIRLATIFGGLVTSIISMGLFIILWRVQGYSDLNQIIQLMLIAASSSVVLSGLILWKKLNNLPPSSDNHISMSKIMTISWPLWITNLTLLVLLQVDLWIMGLFRSPEEVALYGAAARLVAVITMPLLIVNAVVPPLIAEMSALGKIKELEKTLRITATLAGIPSFVVVVIFIISGDFFSKLLYGEFYQASGTVLAILSIGQLINVWAGSCGQVLMLTGHQTIIMIITVFCSLLTIVLALGLVPHYGGIGVASSTSIGIVFQNLLMLVFARKYTGVWTYISPSIFKQMQIIKREK